MDILRLRRCPSCGKVKTESDVGVSVVLNNEPSVICHQCEVDLLATKGEQPALREIITPIFSLSESQVA